jgi:hypothetical protein
VESRPISGLAPPTVEDHNALVARKRTTGDGPAEDSAVEWLLLIYKVQSEPTRLRATVWRRLKSLGAVYVQNSAAALPSSPAGERALRKLRHDITEMNGSAVLFRSSALVGEADVLAAFRAARDDEYEEIVDRCQDILAQVEKEHVAAHGAVATGRYHGRIVTICTPVQIGPKRRTGGADPPGCGWPRWS